MSALQTTYRIDECAVCGNTFAQERRRGRPSKFCDDHRGQPTKRERTAKLTLVPALDPVPTFKIGRRHEAIWTHPKSRFSSLGILLALIRRGETLEETCRRIRTAGHAYTKKVVDQKHYQPESTRARIMAQAKIEERIERAWKS